MPDQARLARLAVDLEAVGSETAVTILVEGRTGTAAMLDTTEGFAIVLCDLKTLLETGKSAGLVAAKARPIDAHRSTA